MTVLATQAGQDGGNPGWQRAALATLLVLALSACASSPWSKPAFETSRSALDNHIRVLASDEYGGREPGTAGGRLTQQYLVNALEIYGFEPGAPGGVWRQNVGLVRYGSGEATLRLAGGRKPLELSGEGVVLQFSAPRVRLEDRSAVFIGSRGSLEAGSLTGQIAFIRYGDYSQFSDELLAADPAVIVALVKNEDVFQQVAERLDKGRFGLIGDEPAKRGFAALSPSMTGELERALGKNLAQLAHEAEALGKPLVVDSRATLTSEQKSENRTTANIIGVLRGKVQGSGAVTLLAHWDHLGVCRESDTQDRLCNGAIDNASGIGMMLETARLIARGKPLDRDLYVIGTTAEELGLLGAKVFVDDPPVPLPTIVAAFNMDTMAVARRGSPLTIIGAGKTALDSGIAQVAGRLGRHIDNHPDHQDLLQRQDGWVLLSQDVPAVVVMGAMGDRTAFDEYIQTHYHKPSDEWHPDLELGGATEDIFLHVELLEFFGNRATYRPGR